MNDPNNMIIDKSMRSVFVGNIPYEATEEKLKDIFSQAGSVASFKLVYDRETGKPKGYGFCEYKDQETALSAMRNLDGFEIAGRKLRVDNACTEKSRMEMQNLLSEPVAESPFGPPCEPSRAPETISKVVASLPPEQMFQLMQHMKLCIQNDPVEARTMLMQNPQLAYALLQAQVVMRIVDPETAVSMLHKTPPPVPPVGVDPARPPSIPSMPPAPSNFTGPPFPGGMMSGGSPAPVPGPGPMQDFPRPGLNGPPGGPPRPMEPGGPRPSMDRMEPHRPPYPGMDMEIKREQEAGGGGIRRDPRDPRSRDPRDRGGSSGPSARGPGSMQQGPGGGGGPMHGMRPGPPPMPAVRPPPQLPPHLAGADPEKAQLIMQVLQLTDEQIAVLEPEQRQSIMVLKEQINQNPGR